MAKRVVEESNLAALANVIRQKAGLTDPLVFPEDFTAAVGSLQIAGRPEPAVLTVNNDKSYSCTYRYYINGEEAWNAGGTILSNGSLTLDLNVGSAVMLMIQTTRSLSSSSSGYRVSYAMTDGIGLSHTINRSTGSLMYYNYFFFAIITGSKPQIDVTLS